MLGGKLFDSKDMGPYTAKNLDKIRSGEGKFVTKDGKTTFVDQTKQTDTKGDNEKVTLGSGQGGNNRSIAKGAGKVFAYPLGRDRRDSEDTLLIKAIEYIPPKSGAGLGVTIENEDGSLTDLGDNSVEGKKEVVKYKNSIMKSCIKV